MFSKRWEEKQKEDGKHKTPSNVENCGEKAERTGEHQTPVHDVKQGKTEDTLAACGKQQTPQGISNGEQQTPEGLSGKVGVGVKISKEKEKVKRGRPPIFEAQQICEADRQDLAELLRKHRRVEHNYAQEQFENFLKINAISEAQDGLPLFIMSARRQGLGASSASTYFQSLTLAYPVSKERAKEREAFGAALTAEKCLADSAPVTDTPASVLQKIVEESPADWHLFLALLFATGCRCVDLLFLHSRCVEVTDEAVKVEWHLTKDCKERGKRYASEYPTKYHMLWPPQLRNTLREQNGTFEHLGHKQSIASNCNSALRRTCEKMEVAKVTTSNFRDYMEQRLRADNVDPSIISKMMHHADTMGVAHYTKLVKGK